uniref:Uncharacterized protein n=1 Tax=Arundo donax TaxID=35708 RepID=A0A0A9FV13_ARUDO
MHPPPPPRGTPRVWPR